MGGQQGLWGWKLCPVLTRRANVTQHHEAAKKELWAQSVLGSIADVFID